MPYIVNNKTLNIHLIYKKPNTHKNKISIFQQLKSTPK